MDPLTTNYQSPTTNYKRRWPKRPLFYIFFLIAIIIGYYAYQLGSTYNKISVENGPWWRVVANVLNIKNNPAPTVDPNPMPEPEKNRLDVLVLGIRGDDQVSIAEEGGLLTDSMMVISVGKLTKKVSIISIPRDLYIDMQAQAPNGKNIHLKGKINEVYERGLENGGGLKLAKQVISRITGVYIDNAVLFDFNAFKELVDTLDGVDIYLAQPFKETKQWGYEFSLPAGDDHLNGDQALYYVRSRYSSSDFDRARRQQEIIVAIKKKVLSLGLLANPLKVDFLLKNIKSNIKTDFQIWDAKDIVALANGLANKDKIINYVISIDNLVYESHDNKEVYALLPKGDNFESIKSLFKGILLTVAKP